MTVSAAHDGQTTTTFNLDDEGTDSNLAAILADTLVGIANTLRSTAPLKTPDVAQQQTGPRPPYRLDDHIRILVEAILRTIYGDHPWPNSADGDTGGPEIKPLMIPPAVVKLAVAVLPALVGGLVGWLIRGQNCREEKRTEQWTHEGKTITVEKTTKVCN